MKDRIRTLLVSVFLMSSLFCCFAIYANNMSNTHKPGMTVITLQSAYPRHLTHLGDLPYQFADLVKKLAGNTMQIRVLKPGRAVNTLDLEAEVHKGTVDAAFSGLSYKRINNPALELFTAVPFGPSAIEYAGWMYSGGGIQLLNKQLKNENIVLFPSALLPAEASGWFKKEINKPADLRGLKIRAYGLTRKIFEALGAKTVMLPGDQIYQALKNNTIDAAEYSTPSSDLGLKLYKVANYYYFPGWHQPATFLYIYLNKDKWQQLTLQQQTIIRTACEHLVFHTFIKLQDAQQQALDTLQTKTNIKQWSPVMLHSFLRAWQKVSQNISAHNPAFKKILNSINKYRKQHQVWEHIHSVPSDVALGASQIKEAHMSSRT